MAEHNYEPSLFPLPRQSTRKTTRKEKKQTPQLPPGPEAEAETEAALITISGNSELSLRRLLPAITQDW